MQITITGCWFPLKKLLNLCLCGAALFLYGCSGEEKVPSEKAGDIVLTKTDYTELSGWKEEKFDEVIPVFRKNCEALQKKNGAEYIYNAALKIKTADYLRICRRFAEKKIKNGREMKAFIEGEFVPYAVSDSLNSEGKFTSYYEAVIHASFTKSGKYRYPVYGRPDDLIEINLKDFDEALPDARLVGRVEGKKFIPYYKRREIESSGIKAPVLMWGDDPVDIHFMQIQGSAIAVMDDGREIRIGFADSNGRKFKGIGGILLEKGVIKQGESSMPEIRKWLRKHPQKAAEYMAENERFIFQRQVDADGPVGAMGVSLTAGRSLAVDNRFIPLGAMMWLDTYTPDSEKLQKIVFAQDIGSAIKGIVRGDYFWGHGEEALMEAGRMNSRGRYFILAPKNTPLTVK